MKWISCLAAALLSVSSFAATLQWEAAPSNGAPAAASYRVYSSPVAAPTAGTWTVYGETAGLSLLITNNAYRMFQVTAVSAAGVESDPSNAVTNHLAKPVPPANAIIRASLDTGSTPFGPWIESTNLEMTFPLISSNQFFRSRFAIVLR